MNEHLQERFRRGNPAKQPRDTPSLNTRPKLTLDVSIREYEKGVQGNDHLPSWCQQREIPTSQEVRGDITGNGEDDEVEVSINEVSKPWPSREEYLEAHYGLLREEAVAPLRNVVSELLAEPQIEEKVSQENAAIYEKVYILGYRFTTGGVAARITFSTRRAGKKIVWEQSKRLITGSLVALTPVNDMFKTICRIAVVAARPLEAVQQNPPEIDIYFGGSDEIEIDPQQEWVMVEARNGYYEACRHTLRSLQKIVRERFPLSEHIVSLEKSVEPPHYLVQQPKQNISLAFPSNDDEFLNVNILEDWPKGAASELDPSQSAALYQILTKRLAVVQGPPGTGKTHVSVVALQILLENMRFGSPPIIIACQTNHALDQLLRHIAKFEPDFVRLGGRTSDMEIIKPRTLFAIKGGGPPGIVPGGWKSIAAKRMTQLHKEMLDLLEPLSERPEPLGSKVFKDLGIITEAQHESLVKGAAEWFRADTSQTPGDMAMWLGKDLIVFKRNIMPEHFGFDFEEVDLEFEQLKELEAETKIDDDDDYDTLKGPYIHFTESFTADVGNDKEENVRKDLEKQDMWEIEEARRGLVYRYMQQKAKEAIRETFRRLAKQYAELVIQARIGRWEVDLNYLKQARVVGMTTTGLSKYRGLVQGLKPKIVLIEEAAETFESHVTASCFDSLEHLILVGDHQQLRGHCSVKDLEGYPFNLDVSMFERLVRNQVDYARLSRQRRMVPEIRRLLAPIYNDLDDHPSVLDKLPVPGMGGVNSYFFNHRWPETNDQLMSKVNEQEADMVVAFFHYLINNGMDVKDITVLTFYNGQRKLILKKLRSHSDLQGYFFKVPTVDSYQGEENGIVLLSLVRSNINNSIGFLSVSNRVCVALSRAQRGFYMFGDAQLLCRNSTLWKDVVKIMRSNSRRIGNSLPLICEKHSRTTETTCADSFSDINGGCRMPCREKLPCGHDCALNCHTFSHSTVICRKPCIKRLPCGHACLENCDTTFCRCICTKGKGPTYQWPTEPKPPPPPSSGPHGNGTPKKPPHGNRSSPRYSSPKKGSSPNKRTSPAKPTQRSSLHDLDFRLIDAPETQAYRDFAKGGHVESDAMLETIVTDALAKAQLDKADEDAQRALFGVENGEGSGEPSPRLMRTIGNEDGSPTRGVWKGVFRAGKGEVEAKVDGGRGEERSLLD